MNFRFEAPPNYRPAVPKDKWRGIFEVLRLSPGEWALVAEMVSRSMATSIKKGELGDALPGEFEAVSRGHDAYPREKADIYARFIGVDGAYKTDEEA